MAPNGFVWSWRRQVDERIATDPDYTQALYKMVTRLNDPSKAGAALDDVVSQRWSDRRRDWYDAAALLEVGQHLQIGWYAAALVPLGAEPGRDKDVTENQEKLDQLSCPYSARCGSGTGDNDGRFQWNAVIRVVHHTEDDQPIVLDYQPTELPLEIGYTDPDTTLWHLWESGGLARWPYGHNAITILLTTCTPGRRCVPPGNPKIVAGRRLIEPPESARPRALPDNS